MPLPQVPDRFQVLEELARGETGMLLRARDKLLQREVVLKLPPDTVRTPAESAAENERELREARALARLQHRAIVRLLDVLEGPAGPVLVLEPTSGESLAERLAREQRLDADFVRALALELADALAAVHAIGVVHRGITLDQILLAPDGRPLLGGFGFAKFSGPAVAIPGTTFLYARDSQAPTALPPHPAPEQIAGQTADARSDLFGLGWVLYQCLTGEEPYPIELEVAHWKTPRDPRALVPGTPRDLSEAVLRCLAKSPAKRFASAEEFKMAMARVPAMQKGGGAPLEKSASGTRVSRGALLATGAMLVLASGYLGWHLTQHTVDADAGRHGGNLANDNGPRTRGPGLPVESDSDKTLAQPPYRRMHAVLIGINDYDEWRDLGYAEQDAQELAKVLTEEFGFATENVVVLQGKDASLQNIRDELGGNLPGRVGPEDGVLLFFAGHGVEEPLPNGGSTGYLVPWGGSTLPNHYQSTLIPMSEVKLWTQKLAAKHVFFILDACYGGLATQERGPEPAPLAFVSRYANIRSRQILTAGGKNEQVAELPELGHSYFTHCMLRGLKEGLADLDHNNVITADELATFVRGALAKIDGVKQSPILAPLLSEVSEGQFMFLNADARAAFEKK